MRKELDEGKGQDESDQPEEGEDPKNPRDPDSRRDGQPEDPESATSGPRRPNVPAWVASLPAQVRDAIVRGDYEQVPARYREKIQEYVKWLQAEEARNAR